MNFRFVSAAIVVASALAGGCGSTKASSEPLADAQRDVCASELASGDAMPFSAGMSASSKDGMFKVAIDSDPPVPMLGDRNTTWTLHVTDASGAPAPDGTSVSVQCTMTHTSGMPSHGCAVTPQTKQMDVGVYRTKPVIFNMQGHWHMDVNVGTEDVPFELCLE